MNARHLIALALIACPLANAHAKTYSNRTFLMPRAPLYNMALEQSTWHHNLGNTTKTTHGASIQASTLYQHSINSKDLGKYFGYYAQNTNEFRDYINVVNDATFAEVDAKDATWASYIIHDSDTPSTNLTEKIKIHPSQEIFGTRLDFYTELSSLIKGLYIQHSLPIIAIKNSLRLTQIGNISPITIDDHPSSGKNLSDYFNGDVFDLNSPSGMQQYPLTHAKMGSLKSRGGIADIETKLGFAFINQKNTFLKIGALATIQTGNRPTGEFIFDPVIGNGQHWEFGGFIDSKCKLWANNHYSVSFLANASCLYGLTNTEKRTIGIQKNDGSPVPFSQYYAVGKTLQRPLYPFANISTQDLEITPGVHCQALANLALTFKNIAIDFGYNLFAKQRENVKLKEAWQNDTYAIASPTTNMPGNQTFYYDDAGATSIDYLDQNIIGQQFIQSNNIDLRPVTTPAQITHKFYGTINHTINGKTPLLFGLGTAYEFGTSNTNIDAYSIWLTANLSF